MPEISVRNQGRGRVDSWWKWWFRDFWCWTYLCKNIVSGNCLEVEFGLGRLLESASFLCLPLWSHSYCCRQAWASISYMTRVGLQELHMNAFSSNQVLYITRNIEICRTLDYSKKAERGLRMPTHNNTRSYSTHVTQQIANPTLQWSLETNCAEYLKILWEVQCCCSSTLDWIINVVW